MRGRILVVDDKENVRKLFERLLGDAHEVVTAADGLSALAKLRAGSFDVVVSDMRMPGADGIEVLRAVKQSAPQTEVILMTAFATVQHAVQAMREGAYDYLPKPFDPDEAVLKIERALEHKLLRDRADALAREVAGKHRFADLIGRSEAMQKVFSLLEKAAAHDLTVLVEGESGTGKELAARAVHHQSARAAEPFIGVNCGAFPPELMESELFGHAKGAFTGAVSDKVGLVEAAGKGTLFLDEIGDLPLLLQVKLNRALQEREYRRVGEARDRKVEARIVAATNVDLRARVKEGRFREDLFYRLAVFPVRMPPLRERDGDLALLASSFLARCGERAGRAPRGFSPEALRLMLRHPWPGNVRELCNVVERGAAVCDGTEIQPTDLPEELSSSEQTDRRGSESLARVPYREAMELMQDRGTREYLISLMRASAGNVSRAAEHAGLARESLHRLLKRHGVDPDAFRQR